MSVGQPPHISLPRADGFSRFFRDFSTAFRKARIDRASQTPHLDVLEVFGLAHLELRHSHVLEWFLKPDSTHEQGPLFANALLGLLDRPPCTTENYHVHRELHGRVDVSCYCRGEFSIFFENKVRHFEREAQVADMVASLEALSEERRIPLENRFAIFLTDSGKPPTSGPSSDSTGFRLENLRAISRIELFELFQTALYGRANRSPLLDAFLGSYLNAIRKIRP